MRRHVEQPCHRLTFKTGVVVLHIASKIAITRRICLDSENMPSAPHSPPSYMPVHPVLGLSRFAIFAVVVVVSHARSLYIIPTRRVRTRLNATANVGNERRQYALRTFRRGGLLLMVSKCSVSSSVGAAARPRACLLSDLYPSMSEGVAGLVYDLARWICGADRHGFASCKMPSDVRLVDLQLSQCANRL